MRRYRRRVLAVAGVLVAVLAAGLAVLLITGHAALVVTHGISMNPVYYQGDLVAVERAPSYQRGDIIAYPLPSNGEVVLHRIVGGDAAGFQIKGDNNESIDATRPASGQIIGRALVHIPQGGTWLRGLTSPPIMGLGTFVLLATGGSTAFARHRHRKRSLGMSRHMTDHPRPLSRIGSLPVWWRCAAALTLVLALAGSWAAAVAWSAPDTAAAGTQTPSGAQVVFSYTAAVPPSAAYDGTTVTAPAPVFRKLTDTVDVHYAYQGAPGTIAVTAELSTQGGWHSSVPLTGATAFPGTRYEGTVHLDLKAMDARAQAAAAVTGIPAGPVTTAVTARVHNSSGDDFVPALRLNLTPLQMALAGGPNDLTVTRPAGADASAAVPAIGINGVAMPVPMVRILSLFAIAVAVLAGTALVLSARRLAPMGEAESIRRRYSSMLARVQPMPIPAGHRVIDVTTFPTLAKLADRYGLLVLHWARSDVETFIVQDENTTYRYRSGSEAPTESGARIPAQPELPRVDTDA